MKVQHCMTIPSAKANQLIKASPTASELESNKPEGKIKLRYLLQTQQTPQKEEEEKEEGEEEEAVHA